jgi:hypothetical protein
MSVCAAHFSTHVFRLLAQSWNGLEHRLSTIARRAGLLPNGTKKETPVLGGGISLS